MRLASFGLQNPDERTLRCRIDLDGRTIRNGLSDIELETRGQTLRKRCHPERSEGDDTEREVIQKQNKRPSGATKLGSCLTDATRDGRPRRAVRIFPLC
jgi:hypothetical protein